MLANIFSILLLALLSQALTCSDASPIPGVTMIIVHCHKVMDNSSITKQMCSSIVQKGVTSWDKQICPNCIVNCIEYTNFDNSISTLVSHDGLYVLTKENLAQLHASLSPAPSQFLTIPEDDGSISILREPKDGSWKWETIRPEQMQQPLLPQAPEDCSLTSTPRDDYNEPSFASEKKGKKDSCTLQ